MNLDNCLQVYYPDTGVQTQWAQIKGGYKRAYKRLQMFNHGAHLAASAASELFPQVLPRLLYNKLSTDSFKGL